MRWTLLVLLALLTGAVSAGAQSGPPQPLTLQAAVEFALAYHPSLQQAEGRVATAQGTMARARAQERPQVDLSTRYTYLNTVPSFALSADQPPVELGSPRTWLTNLVAQQMLLSGGRLEAVVRQTTSAERAAEANRLRARQQVAYGAESAYLMLAASEQAVGVAQETLRAAEENDRVVEARFAERAAAQFEVLRAQVQVEESRQGLISAESDVTVAQAMLANALGLQEGTFTLATTELPAETVPEVGPSLVTAQATRPELAAAEWQMKAAEAVVQYARAQRRPMVSFQIGYQYADPATLTQYSVLSAVTALQMPLFDSGRIRAAIREAIGTRDQTTAARELLRNTVAQEVTTAQARLQSADTQVGVAEHRVALAEEALRISNVRYQEAVATQTEIMDAQAALARARQGLIQARTGRALAAAALRLAMGTTHTGDPSEQTS
jgi:outer membrane protein